MHVFYRALLVSLVTVVVSVTSIPTISLAQNPFEFLALPGLNELRGNLQAYRQKRPSTADCFAFWYAVDAYRLKYYLKFPDQKREIERIFKEEINDHIPRDCRSQRVPAPNPRPQTPPEYPRNPSVESRPRTLQPPVQIGVNKMGRSVMVENLTGEIILGFFATNRFDKQWGPDLLGKDVILPDERRRIGVDDYSSECDFDVRVITKSLRSIESSGNVCGAGAFWSVRSSPDSPRIPSPPSPSGGGPSEAHPRLPTWIIPNAPKPAQTSMPPLSAQDLFRTVSPSVYVVIASTDGGGRKSQGSAVAISRNEAITNCHVVTRATEIKVVGGSGSRQALVSGADAETDRCHLLVFGGDLSPVRGVRDYSDLKVGETVYTIGAPLGLENTLGQGLISGLRENKGRRLVQITAPISSGSSGGGLFDDRGNLIGITTFMLRESQNLNFAIAASDYWR